MKQVIENRTPLQRLLWLGGMAKASGGKLSELTASGNPCVFETDVARPLKRLALSLLPRQSGTGDPSPSNIRPLLPWGEVGTWTGGKNLFDKSKYANIYSASDYTDSANYKCKYIQLVPNKTYHVSQTAESADSSCVVLINNVPKVNTSGYFDLRKAGDNKTYTTDGTGRLYIGSINSNDSDCFNRIVACNLQIEVGDSATAYEEAHITPHPVNVGKNLYPVLIGEDSFINNGSATHGNENGKLVINTIASSSSSGVYLNPSSHFRGLLDDVDGQTVTLSLDIQASENASVRIVFCGKQILFDATPSTRRVSISETVGSTKNLNIYGVNSGATLIVSNVQLEQGEQATAFQPYIPPVYGCEVDLTTGEVWGTYALWTKNTASMDNADNVPGWRNSGIRELIGAGQNKEFGDQIMNVGKYWSANTNSSNDILFLRSARYNDMSQSDWQALAIDVQIAVELATPVLLATLTPQQISAIVGVNTVWSDADDIELTYLKKG